MAMEVFTSIVVTLTRHATWSSCLLLCVITQTSAYTVRSKKAADKSSRGWAGEVRQKLVAEVGSEQLYVRLTKKMADLEGDPFFYSKQLELFKARCKLLRIFTRYDELEISFLSIDTFDQVLHELEYHQPAQETQESDLELGKTALAKFAFPDWAASLLLSLHLDDTECQPCKIALKQTFEVLSEYPESAQLTKLAIERTCVVSLKEACMARVLELGVGQDSACDSAPDHGQRAGAKAAGKEGKKGVGNAECSCQGTGAYD